MSRDKVAIASSLNGSLGSQENSDSRSELIVALIVGLAIGLVVYAGPRSAPRTSHMATHILIMSAFAPFLAALWARLTSTPVLSSGRALAIVTVAQIAVLYAWHAPGATSYLELHPIAHFSMHASLLAAALLFWRAILSDTGAGRWRGVAALAITGKLACLLGVLLLFAPRVLDAGPGGLEAISETMLSDQRLAGLLMLAACPASYLITGVTIASRWLLDMEDDRSASRARTNRPDGARGRLDG